MKNPHIGDSYRRKDSHSCTYIYIYASEFEVILVRILKRAGSLHRLGARASIFTFSI
jgi:hypothetical protein